MFPEHSIINLDNLSLGSDARGADFIKGDITDARLMEKLCLDVDAIVNFAAESHVDRSIPHPIPFFESNTRGVVTILEAIKASKRPIRMVQISTDEVYGPILEGSVKEDGQSNPSSPYAASKSAADGFCLAYHRTYGLDVAICRSTNNFGPYQFPEKLIPKTIIRALLGLKVPLYGNGEQMRDWLYVEDNCRGIMKVLEHGRSGEIYNIAGGNSMPNRYLVTRIIEMLGKSTDIIESVKDRPGHDVRYSLDCSKTGSELGWQSLANFDEALEKTVEWYVKNESWWKPLATEDVLSASPWELKGNLTVLANQ